MKLFKKSIIIVLVMSLLFGAIPVFQNNVWALGEFDINVESYENGVLTLTWNNVVEGKSYAVSYHTPDSGVKTIKKNSLDSIYSCEISELQNDYIYDFKVSIYNVDDLESVGNLDDVKDSIIGEGLMYYIPRVSFYSSRVDQEREAIEGGGYEVGNKPRLNLGWVMPKVWVEDAAQFVNANDTEALQFMRDNLNSIYGNDIGISKLNFKINISNSTSTLNSGSSQSAINVNYDDSLLGYTARVSGNENINCKVSGPDMNGYMNFDLIGRKDQSTPLPEAEEYGLPDGDIIPGTVYYMNIKLSYQDDEGNGRYVTTVGAPEDYNGSVLMGVFPYTYTPIRFQLSKDAADNIYVKIYKINQGSLDLPRMYYEVQSSDDVTIKGDWITKKTIDDSFFASGAESALTLISGVGVNNRVFYKIVVKTDTTNDRLESMPMDYTLAEDASKSPVPTGITIIDRVPVTRNIEVDGKTVVQKSSDITISWEKPANWDDIRENTDEDTDVIYHVLLNVDEHEDISMPYPELKADGTIYGYFPLKYRRVLYFSSKEVIENGKRLEYTIRGFELFKGSYYAGLDENSNAVIEQEEIENDEGYPDQLLPNKVYFMQMYTTNKINRNTTQSEDMSDKSVIVSFTTRAVNEIDVPLPKSLRLNVNDADVYVGETTEISNYVELQFDKVDINWNNYLPDTTVSKAVYYDLYMSTRTDLTSFKFIGSTENLKGDIAFIGADDIASTSIRLIVRDFSNGTEAYTNFGPKLTPNTTYYFVAKTRLNAEGMKTQKESSYTSLLPVTTVKGVIGKPDETSKRPYAPIDFQIALDEDGNQILTSTKVTFSWTRDETDVVYNIISSTRKIGAEEGNYEGDNDAIYQSFLANFDEIMLDPSLADLPENFEYDPVSKVCKYTIDEWLFPNKLYYFSMRAVKKGNSTMYSSWVSIPVTTHLIEQPGYLEAVTDVQLGFFFDDEDLETEAEDYSVYIKAEKDLKFRLLNKNEYSFVKFNTVSYVRLINLQSNTYYSVKVYKDDDTKLVYTKDELYARDSYHQVEIKWRGLPQYRYEILIKTLSDNNYVLLDESNFDEYINVQGKILPYYAEKNIKTSGTDYEYYYSRITSIPVLLKDGTYEDQPLKSNTKYHIKVRAKKIDPVDSTIVSYSKYLGPVFIRTDFNQEDYDEEDNNTRTEASFMDRLEKLEEKLFWRINIKNQDENKILLKGDRVINAMENSGPYPFTLDISNYARYATSDKIYIPVAVIQTLDIENKSFLIRTNEAEYSVRPNTFDLELRPEIKELKAQNNINEIYITLNIERNKKTKTSIPDGMEAVSLINMLDVEALGTSVTYTQLKNQIHDRIYNKDSGLVQKKLGEILDTEVYSYSKNLDDLMNESIFDIEMELSEFIYYKMEGGNGISSIAVKSKDILSFDNPMLINLKYEKKSGLKLPYIKYADRDEWQKLNHSASVSSDKLMFNVIMTGEYAIFAQEEFAADLLDEYERTPDIKLLLSKFDLSGVFGDMGSFFPEDSVKVKEIILLYEKIAGLDQGDSGLTINQKAQNYGLESLIAYGGVVRDVSRQETAKVVMMVYSNKTGVNTISLIPNSSKKAEDMPKVDSAYYKDVLICVDLGLLNVDDEGKFNPNGTISRGSLASTFVELLKLTGDI